jgi:hypothetical protein
MSGNAGTAKRGKSEEGEIGSVTERRSIDYRSKLAKIGVNLTRSYAVNTQPPFPRTY